MYYVVEEVPVLQISFFRMKVIRVCVCACKNTVKNLTKQKFDNVHVNWLCILCIIRRLRVLFLRKLVFHLLNFYHIISTTI